MPENLYNSRVVCPNCHEYVPEEVAAIQNGTFNWKCPLCGTEFCIVVQFDGGQEREDVYSRLYRACQRDHEYEVLEDLAIRAGLFWKCTGEPKSTGIVRN